MTNKKTSIKISSQTKPTPPPRPTPSQGQIISKDGKKK